MKVFCFLEKSTALYYAKEVSNIIFSKFTYRINK